MAAFQDSAHAAELIGGFFRQESALDDHLLGGSGLVMAWVLHDPDLRIVLDARAKPEPGHAYDFYIDDPAAPIPQVEFLIDGDSFDKLHRGEAQALAMLMNGKIKGKGNIPAALRLLPSLKRVISHYKQYMDTHSRSRA